MKNVFKVFGFEFKGFIKKKSFLISTLIIVLVSFGLGFTPRLLPLLQRTGNIPGVNSQATFDLSKERFKDSKVVINPSGNVDVKYLLAIMNLKEDRVVENLETLEQQVKTGEIKRGIYIEGPTSYEVIVNNKQFMDNNSTDVKEVLNKYNFDKTLMAKGINPTDVEGASKVNIKSTEKILGKDVSGNFILAYLYVMLLYILIVTYGNVVASNVAREKSDRTMEILITTTKPSGLIVGKVLASSFGGLFQFGLFVLAGLSGLYLNRKYIPQGVADFIKGLVTLRIALVFIAFILLGYLLYLFIFAALGAKVSRVEDVGTSTLPIVLLFMLSFFGAMFFMYQPDGIIMRVLSLIPLSSPLAMPIRYTLSIVPFGELLLSVGILFATLILVTILSVRLYKRGSQYYGAKLNKSIKA